MNIEEEITGIKRDMIAFVDHTHAEILRLHTEQERILGHIKSIVLTLKDVTETLKEQQNRLDGIEDHEKAET